MTFVRRVAFGLLSLDLPLAASAGPAHAESTLVRPQTLVVDRSLPPAQADALTLAALRYDTFWNTEDPELERLALGPAFIDRTLPPGRAQGSPDRSMPARRCGPRCRTSAARSSR